MAKNTLREFVDEVAKGASAIFEDQGGLAPMLHAVDRDGKPVVIGVPQVPKDLGAMLYRAILAKIGATRVAFIDEAWMHDSIDPADVEKANREGIEHMPGRVEILFISAEDAVEGSLMARRRIIRDGEKVTLGELEVIDMNGAEGRFIGLLPTPTVRH